MRSRVGPCAVVLLLGSTWLTSARPAAATVAAPDTTEILVGEEGPASSAAIALAHRFLLEGSVSVLRGDLELRPEVDYRLDPDEGTLRLGKALAPDETLTIHYAWVPLELPHDFVAVVRGAPTPPDSGRMTEGKAGMSGADRLGRAVGEDLAINGAKTLSIEVGSSKDAAVEQSLRVSVTGRIGEDVRLTALLSDQNIPVQPEGNTQRLEELDEVLIRVEGPRAAATLGDFVATRRGTAFGDFERRLSGAEATVRAGDGSARGIGASTRGNFRTVEFVGEEGKQGPYLLAGTGPNPTGVIVAGSERVWLNGRELTRGDARDYVIDYSRGELEFTNRVLITEDSEIAVDFEVAEQAYKRSFVMGEGSWGTEGQAFAWRSSILSEIDGHDPVNAVLDETRRSALEAATTDATIRVSGAVCDVENGDYDDLGDHFEYAGSDSGTCDVSFTFVGDRQGSYVRDRDLDTSLTYFRFVGPGLGAYVDSLDLAPPRTRTLADMTLRLAGGGFDFAADGAATRDDHNTFSRFDDANNDGSAGRAQLAWTSPALAEARGPVKLETKASIRGESAEFAPIGRTRDVFLGEVWNFVDTTRADETTGEVSARLGAADRWSVGGGYGVLERTGRFRSERREGSANWSGEHLPTARVRIENVQREDSRGANGAMLGELDRRQAELGGRIKWLRPGVSYWREDRVNTREAERLDGADDEEVAGSVEVAAGTTGRVNARMARRTTDVVDAGEWVRESVGRTVELGAEATPGRDFRARVSWIERRLDFEPARGRSDVSTNLTRADVSHESFDGLLAGEYVYETTSKTFSDPLTGPGTGEEPTLAIDASARIRAGGYRSAAGTTPGELPGWKRWLTRVTSETVLRVEEETRTPDRGPIYRLDFSHFQNTDETVYGKTLLRQEVTLFPGARQFSLTGRWERIDTKDNRATPRSTDVVSERRVLRARNRLAPTLTVETQGTWQDDSRGDAVTSVTEFDVRLLEWRQDLVWQPSPARRLSGRGAVVSERNRVNDASIRGMLLGGIIDSSVGRQGRVRLETTWTHPTSQEGVDTTNRFRTRHGDTLEWRGTVDLRMTDSINASLSYSGRKVEGASTQHLARAEVRALF